MTEISWSTSPVGSGDDSHTTSKRSTYCFMDGLGSTFKAYKNKTQKAFTWNVNKQNATVSILSHNNCTNLKLEAHHKQFFHLLQFAIKWSQYFRFLDPAVWLADQLLVSDKHACWISPAHVLEMVEVSWRPLVLPEDIYNRIIKTVAFRY